MERLKDMVGFLVSLKQIIGYFAMWAIRQSPYDIPENLEIACEKLRYELKPNFVDAELGFIKVDLLNIERSLKSAFKKIPEIEAWNEPKNQHKGGDLFVTRYSKINPDDDFIDLDALVKNISMSISKEENL